MKLVETKLGQPPVFKNIFFSICCAHLHLITKGNQGFKYEWRSLISDRHFCVQRLLVRELVLLLLDS